MVAKPPPLRTIDLGRLDASDEATHDPALLLEGYFDYSEAVYNVSNGLSWYLLGPKGAGKSAVFEHLRLKWLGRQDRFFTNWDLRGFPVADVSEVRTGQSAGASRAQSAWELLLLLRIFSSLDRDQARSHSREFHHLVQDLKKNGLIIDDYKLSVSRWVAGPISLKASLGFAGAVGEQTQVTALEIAAVLREGLAHVSSPNLHLIVLDGLDAFFLESDAHFASLAGLVHAIEAINRYCTSLSLRISIAAAIRTEAFEALESTDSNKLKPHCIYLDWSPPGLSADSKLWNLVDTKCRVSAPGFDSFIRSYLMADIGVGPYVNLPPYLLSNTRLLPRDIIALLTHIQAVHPGATQVTEKEATVAVRNYAEQYFVTEVQNNLTGILPYGPGRQRKTLRFVEALRAVKEAEFSLHELTQILGDDLSESETQTLLRQLFQIGAVGLRTYADSGLSRTDFVYRRTNATAFNPRRTFLLHNALITAWNKIRSGDSRVRR